MIVMYSWYFYSTVLFISYQNVYGNHLLNWVITCFDRYHSWFRDAKSWWKIGKIKKKLYFDSQRDFGIDYKKIESNPNFCCNTLKMNDLVRLEQNILIIICKFEKIFFYQISLTQWNITNLPTQRNKPRRGLIRYRQTYTFEK